MLSNPGICRFLGPPPFPAAHVGLPDGIWFCPLPRSRISGWESETDTQPPLCFLDQVALVRRKLNSLVLNSVSDGGRFPADSAFRQLHIRNPPGWVSLLFVYAVRVRFRGCRHILDGSAGHREQRACSVYRSISDRGYLFILRQQKLFFYRGTPPVSLLSCPCRAYWNPRDIFQPTCGSCENGGNVCRPPLLP